MIALRRCRTLQLRGSRYFSLTYSFRSGHNRWSKIKHAKAKTDVSVTKQRSAFVRELEHASRQYGADPQSNPRLANIITAAKKQAMPKASIESAIARGQGRSLTGAALESFTIEAMVPPSVAVIVECQTDSKARLLLELKSAIRDYSGTITPTAHMFDRKGKAVFEASRGSEEEKIFDQAVEAGAIDVQTEEDGKIVVYTEPSHAAAVANKVATSSGLKVQSLDIIWDPKEDMMIDVASPEMLDGFIAEIQEDPGVREIYTNANPNFT